MSSKRNASMIFWTSMDQEICLILEQVSFSLLYWKRNLQTDMCGPGGDCQDRQLTSRADHSWSVLWETLGRIAKPKERQKWSHEKPKLDNARNYEEFISLTLRTRNSKKPLRMLARSWKHQWLLPCFARQARKAWNDKTKSNEIKSKFACILEVSESTKLRVGECLPNHHEDHIAGKGDNSLQHYNLEHSRGKDSSDKEWEKLEKIPAWNVTKVRSKKEVIDEARTKGEKVHFASLMDICHLKNVELEAKHQKYKGQVVLRGDIVTGDYGSHAVFAEQGSSASQMTTAKVMDIISRLPGCASSGCRICLYPGVNGRCSQIIENSQIGMPRHLDSSTTTQMAKIIVQYGRPSCSSWAKSVRSSFGRTVMGKAIWENPFEVRLGECMFPVGNAFSFTVKKGYFYLCVWMTLKLAGKKQNIDPMWKVLNKDVDLGEPTSFLDHVYLGCVQRQWNKHRCCWQLQIHVWIQGFRRSKWKTFILGQSSYFFMVLRCGRSCQEHVWNDIASWQTGRLNNSTKCLHHALIDNHHFKEEEFKSVEEFSKVCSQISIKCLHLARTGRPDILCMVSKKTCTIDPKMDQDLWQTPESFNILHPSPMWIQTVLLCGKYCQTMQTGTVSWLRLCRRSWGFKIYIGWNIVHFWKSYICSDKLDVYETNFSFAQFNRIRNHFLGCRIEVGWHRIPALDSWDLIVTVLGNTNQSSKAPWDLCPN